MSDTAKNATADVAFANDVWVFVEQEHGVVNPVTFELLGEGKKLAGEVDGDLVAVVLGRDVDGLIPDIFAAGADKTIIVDDPALEDYRTYPYCFGLVELINKYRPEILLMGATALGRDLAGAVATKAETGLTADCTQLTIDPETRLLHQTRPAFGGNVMATILCRTARPQMATVRPRVFVAPPLDCDREGEIVRESIKLDETEGPTQVLEFIPNADSGESAIEAADILVAGGRGVGGPDGFRLLEEVARLLGGDVGASRPPVEMGWVPPSRQVGQSGKTVRPKVYFAVGISGAIQHVVGMADSDIIVAINSDPQAPIFEIATFGIVGNLFEILPALAAEIKNATGAPTGGSCLPEESNV